MSLQKTKTSPAESFPSTIPPEVIFGVSDEMRRVRNTIERIAKVRVPVLIRGESGTGKEVLASYLHGISPWSEHSFVRVNCAAIPGALLESELFGHEKGAFTGATSSRPGKFEQAHNGTLLLDEIAEIDGGLQAKLLHALQDGSFTRIGDLEERRADVRIISVTNRDIRARIAEGQFREDLYYRINVVDVVMPSLRERMEDLSPLVDYFLRVYAEQYGRQPAPLPKEAMQLFRSHPWPGNIRELENYIKRYVIMGSMDGILTEIRERRQTPADGNRGFVLTRPEDYSLKAYSKKAAQEAERFLMLEALKETRWNRRRAARLLGISYRALLYKMADAGLPSKKKTSRGADLETAGNGEAV